MMSDNISRNMEQSRNNGIINCPTQLHLVGHLYKICIMMHGSMHVKFCELVFLLLRHFCDLPEDTVISR